jgi:hypothetical protein
MRYLYRQNVKDFAQAMEENRFFKFVWRFNAITFMVAGLLAIGVIFFTGYNIFRETTREKTTRNNTNGTDKL